MCVIVFMKKDGKMILAKNRDRIYKPKVEIIREIINGVEVAYMHDTITNWIEGLNEHGLGMVNSALNVKYDENEKRVSFKGSSGQKILNALSKKNLDEMMDSILHYTYVSDVALQGHTLASSPNKCIHIESTAQNTPIINQYNKNVVFTNHGNNLENVGYKDGRKYISSLLRKKIMEEEIKNIDNSNQLLDSMNKNYINLDPRFHPYRHKQSTLKRINKNDGKCFSTTSQIFLNLSDKILLFRYDMENCDFIKINNKLPEGYIPKIKIDIKEISKDKNEHNIPLEKNYVDNIISTYSNNKNTCLILFISLIIIITFLIYKIKYSGQRVK